MTKARQGNPFNEAPNRESRLRALPLNPAFSIGS